MELSAAERDLLLRFNRSERPDEIQPRTEGAPAVVSHGQQQLWLLDQINPRSREYTVPEALQLTGPLDVQALRVAFTRLTERHEILRTRFVLTEDGSLLQTVDTTPGIQFGCADARERGIEALEPILSEQLHRLIDEPFDLEHGPLLRVGLTRLATEEHLLVLVMHHIVCDGWSFRVIMRELPALYAAARGGRDEPPEPRLQYADFSTWQRSDVQEERFERQIEFWRAQLADPTPAELPSDLPRPPVRTGDGEALYLPLAADLVSRIAGLSRELRVTPYMVHMAVYQMLLSKHTGAEDITVGTPVSGRTRTETEDMIGFFVNTVVIRGDLSGDPPFVRHLHRVREICLDSFSHQDVPFARLVDELCARRDLSRTPLFQHAFIYNAELVPEWRFPHLECRVLRTPLEFAKSDLSITVSEADGGTVRVEYSTDLFHESTARTIGHDYLKLLRSVVDRPHAALSEHGRTIPDRDDRPTAAANGVPPPQPPGTDRRRTQTRPTEVEKGIR